MIWLIGSKGMLGTELSLLLEKSGYSFIGTDSEVDITGLAALEDFIRTQQNKTEPIDCIINCAAYTAVDKAEDDAEKCRQLNTQGVGNIAVCAKSINARLIHISTDYVFDGEGIKTEGGNIPRPYREDDATNPIGVYGLTKRDGELTVLENNPNSYIIRTAWLYGKYGNNFVRTMLKLMNEKETIRVVNDQKGSPTWTYDLSQAIIRLLCAMDKNPAPYGIYHFTDEGEVSWFDFACKIHAFAQKIGILTKNCLITPCTSADFPAKVKRPTYSVLDKTKIKAALNIDIPLWDKSLNKFLTMEPI